VLGIVGSPRKRGNTDTLVDTILSSAHEMGAEVEKVFLAELDISPCKACDACQRGKSCVYNDDMDDIVGKMIDSDIWVIGTPVYWWGPSAILKAFIDRWYGLNQSLFQQKRLVLVIPMGGGNDSYSKHIVGMFEDISNYLGIELYDSLVAPKMTTRKSAGESTSLMEQARNLGKSMLGPESQTECEAKSSTT
jgi:multimeric flavodoxin WrbA